MTKKTFFVAGLFLVGTLLMLSGCVVGRVYTPIKQDNHRSRLPGYGNYRPQSLQHHRNDNYHPQHHRNDNYYPQPSKYVKPAKPPKKPVKLPKGNNYPPEPHQPQSYQDDCGAKRNTP